MRTLMHGQRCMLVNLDSACWTLLQHWFIQRGMEAEEEEEERETRCEEGCRRSDGWTRKLRDGIFVGLMVPEPINKDPYQVKRTTSVVVYKLIKVWVMGRTHCLCFSARKKSQQLKGAQTCIFSIWFPSFFFTYVKMMHEAAYISFCLNSSTVLHNF